MSAVLCNDKTLLTLLHTSIRGDRENIFFCPPPRYLYCVYPLTPFWIRWWGDRFNIRRRLSYAVFGLLKTAVLSTHSALFNYEFWCKVVILPSVRWHYYPQCYLFVCFAELSNSCFHSFYLLLMIRIYKLILGGRDCGVSICSSAWWPYEKVMQ